jgi:plasmid stabilization system protein ParE
MAYRVELTDRALRDLSIIYECIRAESSGQAARWFDRLEKAILSLEKYPNRAPLTPEDSTAGHLLYGRKPYVYRIIFQVDEKTPTVHVLHVRGPGRDRMKSG